jgi:VanZ family protein
LSWLPIIAFSALIFWLSSRPPALSLPQRVPHLDKLLHFGAYGVWGALCAIPVKLQWPGLSPVRFVLAVALAGALYGVSDELHQAMVPSREPSAGDAAADALGALAGVLAARPFLRPRRRGGDAPAPE